MGCEQMIQQQRSIWKLIKERKDYVNVRNIRERTRLVLLRYERGCDVKDTLRDLRRLQRELFDKVVYDELDVLSSQKLHEIAQESLNQYNARGE